MTSRRPIAVSGTDGVETAPPANIAAYLVLVVLAGLMVWGATRKTRN